MTEQQTPEAPTMEPRARQTRNDVSEIAAMLVPPSAQRVVDDEPAQAPSADPELLSGEDPAAEPESTAPAPTPISSFNDLAEQAGLSMKDFYKLEVKLSGDAEPVTLGALKDAWQDGMKLDQRKSELEKQRTDLQNEVLRSTKAIQKMMGDLNLSDAQVQRAALEFDQQRAREQEKLFAIMPELRDNPEVRSQVSQSMAEMLADYGVSRAEIDNIADARFVKFAIDAARWKSQLEAADPNAKRVRKTAGPHAKTPRRVVSKAKDTHTDKLIGKAKQTRMPGDQVNAIAALLGGNR